MSSVFLIADIKSLAQRLKDCSICGDPVAIVYIFMCTIPCFFLFHIFLVSKHAWYCLEKLIFCWFNSFRKGLSVHWDKWFPNGSKYCSTKILLHRTLSGHSSSLTSVDLEPVPIEALMF